VSTVMRWFSGLGRTERPLRVGDWVDVRSKEEILPTLDRNGRLDEMPFMPEMFTYCGRRFRVYKVAHKTCDTVYSYKGRKLADAVHLEGVRCNGREHGGCDASCLIFWKTAWLRRVDSESAARPAQGGGRVPGGALCTEADVFRASFRSDAGPGVEAYVCQATQLPAATRPLHWWEWRQYVQDYASGNVTLSRLVNSALYVVYRRGLVNLGVGAGPALKWLYDLVQKLIGGTPYPHRDGVLPAGARTPSATLDLQPGEWVRVKPFEAIRETCDASNVNRGMKFDPEMVPYCGRRYQVRMRVRRLINERTGVLQEMKNPAVILESVVCQARYAECRLHCPRSLYPFWREIWLERVTPSEAASPDGAAREVSVGGHEAVKIGA
jgi:hypothetical protein